MWKLVGDVCTMARALPPRLAATIVVPPSIKAASASGGDRNSTENILAVASDAYRKRVLLRNTAEAWIDLATSLHFRATTAETSAANAHNDDAAGKAKLAVDAVNAAKQAVQLAPKSHVCWTTLGVASTGASDPALAQHAFIKSIDLEANNPNAWVRTSLFLF